MSPSGERSWTYDLGETEAQGLDAPQESHPQPCLALGLAHRAPVFLPRDTVRHKWPAAPGREALVQPWSPAPAGVGFLRAGPQLHTAGKGRGAGNLRRLCPPRSRGGGRPSEPPPCSQPPAAICLCPSSGRGGAGAHSCTRPSPQLPSQTSFFPGRPRDPHPTPWQCLGGPPQECWGVPLLPGALGSICNVTHVPWQLCVPHAPCTPGSGGHLSTPDSGLRKALELSGEKERQKEGGRLGSGDGGARTRGWARRGPGPVLRSGDTEAFHEGVPSWAEGDGGGIMGARGKCRPPG